MTQGGEMERHSCSQRFHASVKADNGSAEVFFRRLSRVRGNSSLQGD